MDWRDEHDGLLKARLANGESFSDVADALSATFGDHFSRCAVAGRVRRLGLNVRDDEEKHERELKARLDGKKKWDEAHVKQPPPLPPATALELSPKKIPLIYLKHFHCRAIVEEKNGKALFCGLQKQNGSPWCPRHHARFVQKVKDDGSSSTER